MPRVLWIGFISFIFAFSPACALCASARQALSLQAPSFYFLAMADVHFDPFAVCRGGAGKASCPLLMKELRVQPAAAWGKIFAAIDTVPPTIHRDTNYILLQQTLQKAQRAVDAYHPNFILVLGDTLSHDFRRDYKRYAGDRSPEGFQSFVKKTLEFINRSLASTFPATNIYMVVGNNDTYSANYQSVPGGVFFRDAGSLWSTLIQNPADRARMRAEFAEAGFYALDVPGDANLRLVVLNTVLFSIKSSGESSLQAAMQQLDWLHQQLQQAKDRQQQVLIAMHIPPSLDVYLMGRFRLFTAQQFYRPALLARLTNELTAFSPQVVGLITGHLHRDWVQGLVVGNRHDLPVISVPSVSPIFGNDPAFKIYHYMPAVARFDDVYTYTDGIRQGQSWRKVHSLM